jgi:methylenetetrahydrofolate dehydrogenase (NADP+)/methenyltetrahydrofolate cyclohydrolase
MAKILDGKIVRDALRTELKERILRLKKIPTLAILQVGDNPESNAYIRQKKAFGESIGSHVDHIRYESTVSEKEVLEKIGELNKNSTIQGILVQLPLPEELDKDLIMNAIVPSKDVDGLTPTNTKLLEEMSSGGFIPATAKGVMNLLEYYKIEIAGKKVVVMGRSALVGKPIALLMQKEGASVTVCHSKTLNVPEIAKKADILIVAIGKPKFVNQDFISSGQIVIDVGINVVTGKKLDEEVPDKKLIGDVDFEAVKDIVLAISPVPGGVGPMTVASLFENLVEALERLS